MWKKNSFRITLLHMLPRPEKQQAWNCFHTWRMSNVSFKVMPRSRLYTVDRCCAIGARWQRSTDLAVCKKMWTVYWYRHVSPCLSSYVTSQLGRLSLPPPAVGKMRTSFGWECITLRYSFVRLELWLAGPPMRDDWSCDFVFPFYCCVVVVLGCVNACLFC